LVRRRSLLSDCVDCCGWLCDGDVGCEALDQLVDEDGHEGCEECAEDIVVGVVLVNADDHGDDEANDIHPCDCACECKASHYCVQ